MRVSCGASRPRSESRGANLPGPPAFPSFCRRARVSGRLSGNQDGLLILGTSRPREGGGAAGAGADQGTLGVNAYLWRASLDTLSFMPLASADPFGGVIITDWYSPPAAQGERFRATA